MANQENFGDVDALMVQWVPQSWDCTLFIVEQVNGSWKLAWLQEILMQAIDGMEPAIQRGCVQESRQRCAR